MSSVRTHANDSALTFGRAREWHGDRQGRLAHHRAYSLSLSGLGDCAAAATRALRDRLAQGDIRFASDTVGEVEATIANLSRPEMRTYAYSS
jgi:hypothetical protein